VLGTVLRRQVRGAFAGVGALSVRLILPSVAMAAAAVGVLALVRTTELGDAKAAAAAEVVAGSVAAGAAYLLLVFGLARSALPQALRRSPSPRGGPLRMT
jgi:hypothetical protein